MAQAKQLSVVGFAGSLRSQSYNAALLRAAVEHAPENMRITQLEIADIPFFNGDVENEGDPSSVKRIKDAVRGADALLIVTPEYNRSVPAVTKNVIDWLSRSADQPESPLNNKAVAIAAASPGGRGALGSREALAKSAEATTDRLFGETFGVPGVREKVDDKNSLADPQTISELKDWLGRFERHILDSNL